MRRELLPKELLAAVPPTRARQYAMATGWKRVPDVDGGIALMNRPESEFDQLILPLDSTFQDYTERIADVVFTMAQVEDRPPLEVLNDLLMADADVLRFRTISSSANKGVLPLEDGIRLLDGAKCSLLASACSVVAPVKHHARMTRNEAVQLLNACQLGQTERGSFTVTIACPLRAVEQDQQPLDDFPPFTRRASELLMRSAYRIVHLIELDRVPEISDEDVAQPVVSANLCQALLRMQPPHEGALQLSVTWAATRPQRPDRTVPSTVRFSHDYFPIIDEIHRALRSTPKPTDTDSFIGYVDALNGDVDSDGRVQGETTLLIFHEEELIRAKADLGPADYQMAVDAHRKAVPVRLSAVLHLRPRMHKLSNIAKFEILDPHHSPQ